MLIAEIKHKLNFINFENESLANADYDITRMEDVLTSNVFGIIKNVDLSVLNAIFEHAGIKKIDEKPDYQFWFKLDDGTEPDIIIMTAKRCIVVEVKYLSDFDKGSTTKTPQIIREIEQSKNQYSDKRVELLTITKDAELDWNSKVYGNEEYFKKLETNIDLLYHISWNDIYNILSIKANDKEIDSISKGFIDDLLSYLEHKEIGYTNDKNSGIRPFEYFFGDESKELFELVKKFGKPNLKNKVWRVHINSLTLNERFEFYNTVVKYIEVSISKNKLRKNSNSIAMDKIPIELLLGIDIDEIDSWIEFIKRLFKCPYVSLNGENDISLLLHFQKGNYTRGQVSLFTYYRKQRILEFREFR